jgi:hypothetical protein
MYGSPVLLFSTKLRNFATCIGREQRKTRQVSDFLGVLNDAALASFNRHKSLCIKMRNTRFIHYCIKLNKVPVMT